MQSFEEMGPPADRAVLGAYQDCRMMIGFVSKICHQISKIHCLSETIKGIDFFKPGHTFSFNDIPAWQLLKELVDLFF